MMAYNKMARWMIVLLYMSYSIPIYSMDDELHDPVGNRPQNSYFSLGINSQWLSRCCPSWLRSDRPANRVPIIAPTQPSSMATVSSKYSRKEIAMITGLVIGVGMVGYYVGN